MDRWPVRLCCTNKSRIRVVLTSYACFVSEHLLSKLHWVEDLSHTFAWCARNRLNTDNSIVIFIVHCVLQALKAWYESIVDIAKLVSKSHVLNHEWTRGRSCRRSCNWSFKRTQSLCSNSVSHSCALVFQRAESCNSFCSWSSRDQTLFGRIDYLLSVFRYIAILLTNSAAP